MLSLEDWSRAQTPVMPELSREESGDVGVAGHARVGGRAGKLCLVTDGVLVVPCLRSIIRADDTDEWTGAPVDSASNYDRWTMVMTAQTVRRECLFDPLDTNFNFVI